MLKIGSVYKQCKTHHLQVYVEERKGNDVENWKYNMLRDSHDNDNDDDGYFEVKEAWTGLSGNKNFF